MIIPETRKSIDAFLSELSNRIKLLSGKKVTENIDNSKVNEINSILTHYNISKDEAINPRDLKNIEKKDLVLLLTYVGQNQDSIEYMMSKVDEYYESIANIINKYICDFISIGTNQAQMFNEKITLYQKYIDLFSSSFEEPFNEINEISKVMSEIGLPDEDKWKILAYIALENNKAVEDEDINFTLLISREAEKLVSYLEDERIIEQVRVRLESNEVDIDTIPTIAHELSYATLVDEDIMTNIVVVTIASNLLTRYRNAGNKDDKEEINSIISSVLNHLRRVHAPAYYEALAIKHDRLEFYYNSLENGISESMFKEYIDLPLSEIKGEYNSLDYAIDLKELAVLKPIFDTIETINSLDSSSQEYQKAINVLKKLNEQYKLLEEKRVTNVEAIN